MSEKVDQRRADAGSPAVSDPPADHATTSPNSSSVGARAEEGGTSHENPDRSAQATSTMSLLRDPVTIALLLAATLTILSNSIISPGLPGIRAAFEGSADADLLVPLLVTAPSLLVAIFAPFSGWLADRFGPRRQLLFGIVLFTLAGTAGLWLDTLNALLISRLVLGVSVALIMTGQTVFVGNTYMGTGRSQFLGLQLAATNLSGFVFILLAGWLAGISPFLPFVIYAVALLYLPAMWRALKDPLLGFRERSASAAPVAATQA